MSNFRPRLFAQTMGERLMKNLLLRKTRLMLLGAMLCASLTTLTGCSVPTKIVSDEPLPTLAEWNEPQSPRAKSYSLKAQAWLKEVDAYFKTYPRFTTPE